MDGCPCGRYEMTGVRLPKDVEGCFVVLRVSLDQLLHEMVQIGSDILLVVVHFAVAKPCTASNSVETVLNSVDTVLTAAIHGHLFPPAGRQTPNELCDSS